MNTDDILNIVLKETDIGTVTIRGYLKKLLTTLWNKEDGFSGKRPF